MKHQYLLVAAAGALSGICEAQVLVGQSHAPAGWIEYGTDMAAAGDIDGDGASEIFVGARLPGPGGSKGLGLRVLSGLDLHVLWERSEAPTASIADYTLPIVDGGRDVNGDGVPDLLLTADGPLGQGRIDLLSGVDGSVIHHTTAIQFIAYYVVAARFVGDVDGDGTDDYVAAFAGPNWGKLVWLSGATGAALHSVQLTPTIFQYGGYPVHTIGDLNGDGVLELCIGDFHFNGFAGRAWIHDGRTGAVIRTIDGQANWEKFGACAAGLGDIDGDGRLDFAIAAPSGIQAAPAGKVRAFSGATGAQLWEHSEPQTYLAFGSALSGMRDLDDDGIAELLVGSVTNNVHSSPYGVGHAWILSGASGATLTRIGGSSLGDFFGAAVQAVDLDADGRSEIVIAAPDTLQQATPGGRLEVFSTCPLPPQRTCVGNQSQAGCIPALVAIGSTIWSAPVRITLVGNDLPRDQPSLLLVGRDGGQLTFGANTLCLAPPFRRILPQNTGGGPGLPPCAGHTQRVLDQPLLASLGFGPGDGLTVQLWIADPPATRGALSDALRIVLCP